MRNPLVIISIILFSLFSCNNDKTEKVQAKRNNTINVSHNIIDIKADVLFGSSLLYILDEILIINEISPKGSRSIHLFDKNSFEYIVSTGITGKGPGEISNPGRLCLDKKKNIFWAPDHGRRIMYRFPLDSILENSHYKPNINLKLNKELFLERFGILNDSTAVGIAWNIMSNNSFEMMMASWDLSSNKIEKFGYSHPDAKGKKANAFFAISNEHGFYVNCYSRLDLMTICDLDGKLMYNVYGPGWSDSDKKDFTYFFDVDLFGDKIIASFIGDEGIVTRGNITRGAAPSKLLVFDKAGNYLKTIDTGYEFERFCVDEKNNRIVAYFINREEALGYFDISFLL